MCLLSIVLKVKIDCHGQVKTNIHKHTRSRSSISIGMAGKSNARGGPLLGILEEVRKIRLLLFALHPIDFSIDSEKSGLLRN